MNERFRRVLDTPAAQTWSTSVRAEIAKLADEAPAERASITYLHPEPVASDCDANAAVVADPLVATRSVELDEEEPAEEPAEEPVAEPWVTATELSALMSVVTKTIGRWMGEGMPYGGRRGGTVRFKLSECETWRSERQGRGEALDPQQARLRVERLRSVKSSEDSSDVPPEASRTRANAAPPRRKVEAHATPAIDADERVAVPVAPAAEPWVGVVRIAQHLDCREDHIYELAKRTDHRRIPHRREGRRLLFKISRVDEWLERNGAQ